MKKKWFSILVFIIFGMISWVNVTAYQPNSETLCHCMLKVDDAPQVASCFTKMGYDVMDDSITADSFEFIAHPLVVQRLRAQGYFIDVLSQGRAFKEIQQEHNQQTPLAVPPGYLDYPAVIAKLNATEANYSSICKVYDLTALYNLPPTYEGRHLYALKISDNVAQNEDEPNFLMVGAHHAREIVTPVLALYAVEQFTTQYGTNASVTAAVNNYELWIAPVWNPDGYSYVFNFDNMWRKNRHPYPPGIGVDLNRNYPIGWDSQGGGSTDPLDETYKGPTPASENETRTMMAFGNDRHFAKVLDYHSSGREVIYAYLTLYHPFTSFLQSEAVRLAIAVGYGGATRLASADGENYQWHLAFNGSYSNLIETHTSFQPSYASALSEASLVWPGTLWFLQRPISLSGHVTDSVSQAPVVASLVLEGIQFQNGEHFMSEPRHGRYHFFLPPGTYTVNYSAPGYFSQTHQVTVSLTSAETLEVHLARINDPPYTPTITGNTTGFVGKYYDYRFSTTDPNNDSIQYLVDWGDGTTTSWLGPFPSGQEAAATHQWNASGAYQVKVKARDTYGAESPWSAPLPVSVVSFKRQYVLGFIADKNETSEYITFHARFLFILPSTPSLYRSGETIMISKDQQVGFVGERVVFGRFQTLVLE